MRVSSNKEINNDTDNSSFTLSKSYFILVKAIESRGELAAQT